MKTFTNFLILSFLFISTNTLLVESCNAIDKEALLDFKHKIKSDPSKLLKTWVKNTDCCTSWDGVDCDPTTGRVVNVTRSLFGLDGFMTGTLSPFLGNITYLQLLDFSYLQNISGPIPKELGKLSHLTQIFLRGNKLNGPIPDSFSRLQKLQYLLLNQNRLSGVIPPFLFQSMRSLSQLDLSRNKISGSIPDSIGKLTKLSYFSIYNNKLTGVVPASIGRLVSLQNIDLGTNRLTGSLPNSLGNLSSIITMSLKDNKISGKLPSSLGQLPNLAYLDLSNNHIEGQIPTSFGNFKSLQGLTLTNNRIVGPIPAQLAKIVPLLNLELSYNPLALVSIPNWIFTKNSLNVLSLAGTGLKGQLPRQLASSHVSTLDLSSNELTGKMPSWIASMGLTSLNLSNNGFYSSIPIEFKNFSTLVYFDIHSNKFSGPLTNVFDKEGESSGLQGESYRIIDVSSNMFTGPIDSDIGSKPAFSPLLTTSLILSNNPLGGTIPKSIGNLTGLEVLEMAGNRLSGSIPKEVLNLENLQVFDVSRNKLSGMIPRHKSNIPASAFSGNPGLCGAPLPPCKHS